MHRFCKGGFWIMRTNLNILITGASRGIGNAIAMAVAHRANNLLVTSHYQDSLEKGINNIKQVYDGSIFQISIEQARGAFAAKKVSVWAENIIDHLDVLILCAGNYFEGSLMSIPNEDFQNTMDTNFSFNYYIVKSLYSLLKKSNYTRVVIIGSTAAYGAYSVPTYSVSKYALRGFAANLRAEFMGENIGVTFVSPGGTLTDMWSDVDVPPNRLLEPTDIAKVVDSIFDLSDQAVVDEIIVRPMLGDYDE